MRRGRRTTRGPLWATALLLALLASALGGAKALGPMVPVNPTVTATATPSSGPAPLAVSFVANGSGGFTPYTFAWAFGDGSSNVSGATATHTFAAAGTYTVHVTLTDYYGATASTSVDVVVGPTPLSVTVLAQPTIVTVDATALLETSILGGVGPFTIRWSGLPPGCPSESVENYSCQPTEAGNYTLTATVTDALGNTASGSARLTVLGGTPPPPGSSGTATSSGPTDLELALGAVAVGLLAVIAGVALRRRRQRGGG